MKFIERYEGHIDFINMDYIIYAYKANNFYYVRILGLDKPLEVSKEIFKKIVEHGREWIKQETVQCSNS